MQNIIFVLKLLPSLIEAIKAIEAAIPGSGKGEEKLSAIRQILEQVDSAAAAYWPSIERAIAVLVGLFNRVGVFSK